MDPDKKIEQMICQYELDEFFESEVSLRTLIGNSNQREIAQNYIDSYYNDVNSGLSPKLAPILLVGSKEAGVDMFARSISNSFGCLAHHTISGNWLSDLIVNLHSFLGEGNEYSSYYIHGDRLNSTIQVQLFRILSERKIQYYDYESKTGPKRDFKNRLVILSVENKEMLAGALLKLFPIKLYLNKLSELEVNLALNQRVNLMKIKISPIGLLAQISFCCPTIGKAIEVLAMSWRICRCRNGDVISEKDVNSALHLINNNKSV